MLFLDGYVFHICITIFTCRYCCCSSDADRPRPMVYHAQHCPLYAHRHHHDHKKQHTQEQHLHDHNHQHDDILLEDEEEEEDVFDVEDLIHGEETDVVEADGTVGGGPDGTGTLGGDYLIHYNNRADHLYV